MCSGSRRRGVERGKRRRHAYINNKATRATLAARARRTQTQDKTWRHKLSPVLFPLAPSLSTLLPLMCVPGVCLAKDMRSFPQGAPALPASLVGINCQNEDSGLAGQAQCENSVGKGNKKRQRLKQQHDDNSQLSIVFTACDLTPSSWQPLIELSYSPTHCIPCNLQPPAAGSFNLFIPI